MLTSDAADDSGAVLAFTIMWIMWLFCALHYILSAPLDKVCTLITNEDIASVIPVQSNK